MSDTRHGQLMMKANGKLQVVDDDDNANQG
jgi:hypothetical protein